MDIKGVLMMEDLEVFEFFKLEAKSMGREMWTDDENYLFIKGTDRICLVAHVDTVGGEWRGGKRSPVAKKLKERHGLITAYRADNKHQRTILGADDRAGCYGLLEMMKADQRTSILLTNYEERGGIGAGVFTDQTELWRNFDFMVELDRAGVNEYVQYNENTQEVHNFIGKFGISNGGWGSYSDIATISRKTKIPSVNLAIGYRAQHTDREFLDIAGMELAIKKTQLIVHRYCTDKPQLGQVTERQYKSHHVGGQVYTWKPRNTTANEDEIVDKCVECGQTRGEHYRSCSYYVEDRDQQAFPFE